METNPTQNGKISKSVAVETDAPGARSFRLVFSADVEAPVLAMPTLRFTLSAVEGEPAESRILLRRADGRALLVVPGEISNPALTVRSQQVSEAAQVDRLQAEPGDVWLVLATKAGEQIVNSNGTLKVTTNQPDVPALEIPYTVRVRPLIDVRPVTAQLWIGQEDNTGRRQTVVTLTGYNGQKFKITGIEVSDPELFSARADSQNTAIRHRLWVDLTEGAAARVAENGVKGFVNISTDLPGRENFKLPVLVESRRSVSPHHS